MLTMNDIARLSGCSRSTVHAVVSGKSWVSEKTRNRVRAVIQEQQWVPDRMASGLVGGSTNLIALILKDILNPFNSKIVEGVNAVLNPLRYNTLLLSTMDDHSRELEAVKIARGYRVDGIIIIPQHEEVDLQHLWRIRERGECCVTLGRCPGLNLPWVELDEVRAVKEIVEHLVSLGHRKIGFLKGPGTSVSSRLREEGFREGLLAHGLSFEPSWMIPGGAELQSGYRAAAKIFAGKTRPTALVCYNDLAAAGVYRAAAEHSLKIPADLSVAGFDDIELAEVFGPPLTTVRQPCFEMGSRMAEMILADIEKKREGVSREVPDHYQFRGTVVRRGSTAPPAGDS